MNIEQALEPLYILLWWREQRINYTIPIYSDECISIDGLLEGTDVDATIDPHT